MFELAIETIKAVIVKRSLLALPLPSDAPDERSRPDGSRNNLNIRNYCLRNHGVLHVICQDGVMLFGRQWQFVYSGCSVFRAVHDCSEEEVMLCPISCVQSFARDPCHGLNVSSSFPLAISCDCFNSRLIFPAAHNGSR